MLVEFRVSSSGCMLKSLWGDLESSGYVEHRFVCWRNYPLGNLNLEMVEEHIWDGFKKNLVVFLGWQIDLMFMFPVILPILEYTFEFVSGLLIHLQWQFCHLPLSISLKIGPSRWYSQLVNQGWDFSCFILKDIFKLPLGLDPQVCGTKDSWSLINNFVASILVKQIDVFKIFVSALPWFSYWPLPLNTLIIFHMFLASIESILCALQATFSMGATTGVDTATTP